MKTVCAAIAAAALLHSMPAMAECRKMTAQDLSGWAQSGLTDGTVSIYSERRISFGATPIDVDATLPVNGTIATATTPAEGRVYVLYCDGNAGTIHYDVVAAQPATAPGLYPTGMPGIAYRISYERAGGSSSVLPFSSNWTAEPPKYPPAYLSIGPGNVFKIELIKTGDMQSQSTINLATVARLSGGGDGTSVLDVRVDPVTLRVLPHCWVASSKSLLVDFGSFGPKEVSTVSGPTKPVTINVACDGPTAPNSVSATLSASPDTAAPDYIRNDGDASNLAIRLREAGSSYVLKPQDPSSVLTKSSPGFQTTFSLEASVLRVGSGIPAPGSIDAQAVVTLTFL